MNDQTPHFNTRTGRDSMRGERMFKGCMSNSSIPHSPSIIFCCISAVETFQKKHFLILHLTPIPPILRLPVSYSVRLANPVRVYVSNSDKILIKNTVRLCKRKGMIKDWTV